MFSGGRHGLAQSVFQVGGNFGSAAGPLLAAFIVLPRGQTSVAWFSCVALLGMVVLFNVGHWYKRHGVMRLKRAAATHAGAPRRHVTIAIAVLLALIFSKYFYLASITSYYTFYLIDHFHVSVRNAQLLNTSSGPAAPGCISGPIGISVAKIRRHPAVYAASRTRLSSTSSTAALTVPIGLILSSAFPAIVVYA
jgi:FSR family fosmidomycin resistance protein-like MFS transporter